MPVDARHLPRFLDLLNPESRQDVLDAAETLDVPKGFVIFRTGEVDNGLYELVEGKVKLTRLPGDTPDHPVTGHESLLRLLPPGQIFGEVSTFDGGPRNATAITVTRVIVRRYSPEVISALIHEHTDVALALLHQVAHRLRTTLDRTTDLHIHDSANRLAKAILMLSARFGVREGDTIVVRHDLTQSELGALTGLSRETVSKLLADFSARGMTRNALGRVVILDEAELRQFATANS